METNFRKTPRLFKVGLKNQITIKDFGDISLEEDEQVTFNSKSGAKYDFTKKNWGFYATQSINKRLINEGFKTALVSNRMNHIYIMVVEVKFLNLFKEYCEVENQKILIWLDDETQVNKIFNKCLPTN